MLAHLPTRIIRHEALEVLDGNGGIVFATAAGFLAGVMADTTAHAGEGEPLPDEVEGFFKTALSDEGHVALHVDSGGASGFTGGRGSLLDGEDRWGTSGDGIDGLLFVAISVHRHRADFSAFAAVSATGQIYVMGRFSDFKFQAITCLPLIGNPGTYEHVDKRML